MKKRKKNPKEQYIRYLLLADIHGNLEALKAVLADAAKFKCKRTIVLGDTIGYYAKPNECLNLLNKKENVLLMGNMEAAIIGKLDIKKIRKPEIRKTLEWTKKHLTEKNIELIKTMPKFFGMNLAIAVHGTPMNFLNEYMDKEKAIESFRVCSEQLILCAHSHKPFIVTEKGILNEIKGSQKIVFRSKRLVVSLPSVGHPKDGDPRAGYTVLDLNNFELHFKRVKYNINKTAENARKEKLPEKLIEKLYKAI